MSKLMIMGLFDIFKRSPKYFDIDSFTVDEFDNVKSSLFYDPIVEMVRNDLLIKNQLKFISKKNVLDESGLVCQEDDITINTKYLELHPSKLDSSGNVTFGFSLEWGGTFYGLLDQGHHDRFKREELKNLSEKRKKEKNKLLRSQETQNLISKTREIFTLTHQDCFNLGKEFYEKNFGTKIQMESFDIIRNNINRVHKKLNISKMKLKISPESLNIKTEVYEDIIVFGYMEWFWNKVFNEGGYFVTKIVWRHYCLKTYGKDKDVDGDILDFEVDNYDVKDYPTSLVPLDFHFFYYLKHYEHFEKGGWINLITGEKSISREKFSNFRDKWYKNFVKKLLKDEKKKSGDRYIDIEETLTVVYNEMFEATDTEFDIWKVGRFYVLGQIFTILTDYIFYRRKASDIYLLFECLKKWENGTLLSEKYKNYENQRPVFLRWGKKINRLREMGKILVHEEGGLDWLENEVGGYLKKRQGYYNKFVEKEHELYIDDSDIRKVTDDLEIFSVQWKSEYKVLNLLKDLVKDLKIEVISNYRPKYLKGLELDIFFNYKRKKYGIEYQGVQHFEPIDFFGGKDSLVKVQERDKRKKELCQKNKVNLIYYNHDEEISISVLKEKIEKFFKV